MIVLRETEKARQLEYDGISFWIQKRWQKADGTLTPAGKKSLAIAARRWREHAGFDALKAFPVVQQTERAVLLRCVVDIPREQRQTEARFWIPRTMINDYRFVAGKVRELERGFPFEGTKVLWRAGA